MNSNSAIEQRKKDHITINLEQEVTSLITNGLEKYQFQHCALPELNFDEIDTLSEFLGKRLSYPILVSSMTGGTERAGKINRNLALIAHKYQFAMGVGSQRAGLENGASMATFKVRQFAPNILLFANLGAVQLNYSHTIEHCKRAIDAIEADALILHLNPLQEALMDGGDTKFSGLLKKIQKMCKMLQTPVVVKEVGWGISKDIALKLEEVGVKAIDVAGAGGTSWSEVEKFRNPQEQMKTVANAFRDWGIPTAQCIIQIRQTLPDFPLIASGGIKNGVEIAKCLALGANLGGMAREFLLAASDSFDAIDAAAFSITKQLKVAMFAVGAKNLVELQNHKILRIG